ncbi:MAG: major capsid family protein [Janthinobacterium lividum]
MTINSSYSANFHAGTPARLDNQEMLFFAHELQTTSPKDFEVISAPLSGINLFHDVKVGELDQLHVYNMFETTGASAYFDAQNGGKQFNSPLRDILIAVPFTDFELKAQTIRNTISAKKRQALQSNYALMNHTLFFGNNNAGLPGLLNNKQLETPKAVANQGWAKKTSAQVLDDLNESYDATMSNTNNLIPPDTMLISASVLNFIKKMSAGTNNLTQSVLDVFLENSKTIKNVVGSHELNKAFNGGTNGFVLFKNDVQYVYHVISIPFRTLPPESLNGGLAFRFIAHSRHGGLIIVQPKMFTIRYGI